MLNFDRFQELRKLYFLIVGGIIFEIFFRKYMMTSFSWIEMFILP